MGDLREIYQEVILDHNRNPRNFRRIEQAACHADGRNPLCGDQITVYLTTRDGRIEDASFEGAGCAICTASASLMTQAVKGKTEQEAKALFERFHALLTDPVPDADASTLGKLAVFAGVREFPIRVKCATLPWHAFAAALQRRDGQPVTTE
jgi:nitrogen fixation NifU-like protein